MSVHKSTSRNNVKGYYTPTYVGAVSRPAVGGVRVQHAQYFIYRRMIAIRTLTRLLRKTFYHLSLNDIVMYMLKIIISITTLVSLCFLVMLLNTTTPANAGPFGILAIFIFAYVMLIGIISYIVYYASRIISRLSIIFRARRPYEVLSFKHSYYYSSVIAALPILLIGLQSVGAIGIYELFLVIFFAVIGILYVSKRVR